MNNLYSDVKAHVSLMSLHIIFFPLSALTKLINLMSLLDDFINLACRHFGSKG